MEISALGFFLSTVRMNDTSFSEIMHPYVALKVIELSLLSFFLLFALKLLRPSAASHMRRLLKVFVMVFRYLFPTRDASISTADKQRADLSWKRRNMHVHHFARLAHLAIRHIDMYLHTRLAS